MIAPILASLLCGTLGAPLQDEPDPEVLLQQARGLLPTYEGDHKAFLSPAEARRTRAARGLLLASCELRPAAPWGYWWLGHAEVLLGEDARNRGRADAGRTHTAAALGAYERALALDPEYYWAHYARAMALLNLGRPWRAIEGFDRATTLSDAAAGAADAAGDQDTWRDARFVRFKARQWRADARMQTLDFERAREEFRAFYADNGNNRWDLGYSLAETWLRARDFAGARSNYLELLAEPELAGYDLTHAQLGYLAGLLGDTSAATARLADAIARERAPTLYTRLWLWILSPEEGRPAVRADLEELLASAPPSVTPWDVTLGRSVLGEGSVAELRAAGEREAARRKEAGEDLGDLPCEVAFYAGLRLEREAAADRAAGLVAAQEAYCEALGHEPRAFKWEWAYARLGLARVAGELGEALPTGATGLHAAPGEVVELSLTHRPGEPRPRALEGEPRAGDLHLAVVRLADGARELRRTVVGAGR